MFVVETIARLRRAHFVRGSSIKAICRALRVARRTAREEIRPDATAFRYGSEHEPTRIVGDLLTAAIPVKHARSIRYQITMAKLPLAKDIDDFVCDGTPINETLVRDLAGGNFLAHQRNVVLVGGTGTGTTHLAIAIARSCIRGGVPESVWR